MRRRHKHSLSHYTLLTANMGVLTPVTWFEVLPGDTVQQRTQALIRLQPLLSPVMHPVVLRFHHWFVPLRLIWEDFENFITGGETGDFEASPPHTLLNGTIDESSLHDYLGIKPADYTGTDTFISMLPFRAYNLIYNEHYRDQQLTSEVAMSTASGLDVTTNVLKKRVAWEKDYLTTARPSDQLGNEVTIPLGDKAPVMGIGRTDQTFNSAANPIYTPGGNTENWGNSGAGFSNAMMQEDPDNAGFANIYADLAEATGISVNQLREALAIQRYQEARNKYGARYVEYLRYLGVRPSDARLQNPEYLGGGKSLIQFSEVLQTQATGEEATPLGHMAGHGITGVRGNRYRRFFEEHGIVMTMMSAVPKSIYMDQSHRKWARLNKEMYFQKELQWLGDQAVYNREVKIDHTTPDGIFGYQDRYDDYRFHPSGVAGEFRSTLNHWHMARDLDAADPALNNSFIVCNPTDRIYASLDTAQMYCMVNHSIQARRLLIRNASPRTF